MESRREYGFTATVPKLAETNTGWEMLGKALPFQILAETSICVDVETN